MAIEALRDAHTPYVSLTLAMQVRLAACRQQLRPSRSAFSVKAVAATAQTYGKTEKVCHYSSEHLQNETSSSPSQKVKSSNMSCRGSPTALISGSSFRRKVMLTLQKPIVLSAAFIAACGPRCC